jgi:flagellar biosynthesis/type III secretory pathway chaperone
MTPSTERLPVLLVELRQVLEEERSILLSGTPEGIGELVKRKLSLAEEIEVACELPGTTAPSPDTLTWLARYNRENSVICSAILQHMTKAIDKLRRQELHRSYGPDGTEQSPAAQNPLGAA